MSPGRREAELKAHTRRFREAGLPLFDEDFSAATDVFNRAAPLLAFVFLAEILGAIKLEWGLLANLGALLGGLAILLGAAALINRARRRPMTAAPEDVGRLELAGFVFVPGLLPLVFGGQLTSAVVTVAANAAFLLVIYAVLAYGLPSILAWVFRRLARQLTASVMLLARAVPLLLIFALLAFVNTEMWQVFAEISDAGLIMIGVLFLLLGTAFLFARLPREVEELIAAVGADEGEDALSERQRRNVGLVLFVGQAVQVLTVALVIMLFFVVFGAVAITEPVRVAWIGNEGDVLTTIGLFGQQFQVTAELLKVAGGLAAFSGLYFAIAMLTDTTYREEFLDEVTAELRSVFRERREYLRLRAASPPAASAPASSGA